MTKTLTVAKRPCGSCPYRKDVPSGVWSQHEYDKLPRYDGPMWSQDPSLFMCHQRDGCLCAGWLATHGSDNLMALRIAAVVGKTKLAPEVMDYQTDVPVFASGAEAREHGMADIDDPGDEANALISKLQALPGVKLADEPTDDRDYDWTNG